MVWIAKLGWLPIVFCILPVEGLPISPACPWLSSNVVGLRSRMSSWKGCLCPSPKGTVIREELGNMWNRHKSIFRMKTIFVISPILAHFSILGWIRNGDAIRTALTTSRFRRFVNCLTFMRKCTRNLCGKLVFSYWTRYSVSYINYIALAIDSFLGPCY